MNGSNRRPIVWTWPIIPGYMAPKRPVEQEAAEEMKAGSGAGGSVQDQPEDLNGGAAQHYYPAEDLPPSPEAATAPGEEKEVGPAQVAKAHGEAVQAAAEERVPPPKAGHPPIPAPTLDHGPGYDCEGECQFEREKMRLARAYVPCQRYGPAYSPREALERGTLFPDLYSPYPY
ncbi:MAG: spore coat associated protein CotJA [Actinobacteria bacterium]|nr:spore coat associated protein CotJA [Actinomycetota bacterium]